MPIRVRLGDKKEALVHEIVSFREKAISYFRENGLHCNPGARVYLNLDPSKFEEWDHFVTAESIFSFHRCSPTVKKVNKLHPLKGVVKDADGNPVIVEELVFSDGPHTQLKIDFRHTGFEWNIRILMQDLTTRASLGEEVTLANLRNTVEEKNILTDNLWSDEVVAVLDSVIPFLRERTGSLRKEEESRLLDLLKTAEAVADVDEQVNLIQQLGELYFEAGLLDKAVECLKKGNLLQSKDRVYA